MRQRLVNLGVAIVGLLVSIQTAAAQNASGVKEIAPFVDQSTFLIVRVNAAQLDVETIIRQFGGLVPIDKKEMARASKLAESTLKAFRNAGGEKLYVGMSMEDGWAEPFFAVPRGDNTQVDAILKLLRQVYRNGETFIHRDTILVGNQRCINRIKALEPTMPKAFAAEFKSKDSAPLQGVLWLPAVLQKALSETAPGLPGFPDGDAAKPLWLGWNRIAFALETKPNLQIRLTVHAIDEQAADSIEQVLGGVLVQLRNHPQIQKEFGDFGKLIPLLRPQNKDGRLQWSFDGQALAKLVKPMLNRQRGAAQRAGTHAKLRQIGLAMHNYHDTHKTFPAHANYDANGKPLLSWRVHLLPYLAQQQLYKQFKLNEPWDSPHNKKLIAKMPNVYQSTKQSTKVSEQGKTRFLAPVGKNAVFFGKEGRSIRAITDGSSNTIMVVEASEAQAVIWTKPSDFSATAKDLRAVLFGPNGKQLMAVFADGSSHVLDRKLDLDTLRALFTIDGGEVVNLP